MVASPDHLGDLLFICPLDQKVVEFRELGELYPARGGEVYEALIDNEFFRGVFMKKIILFHLEEDKVEGDQGIDREGSLLPVHGSQVGEKDIVFERRGDKLPHPVTFNLTLDGGFPGYFMELAYDDLTKGDDQIAPIG